MKKRNGFVSNSSSTSFCIYGTILNKDEVEDAENKLESLKKGQSFLVQRYGEYDDCYVGAYWNEWKNDETKAEFLSRVSAEISRILGLVGRSVDQHFEGWYNG